jgi:cytochrome c oxidase subunit 2
MLALGALLSLLPAAAAWAQTQPETFERVSYWLPRNVSTFGHRVDWLFHFILWMTTVVGVLVFAAMIWFVIRYRHRPGRVARYTHGNMKLELAWTIIPTLILAFTAAISQATWKDLKYVSEMPSGAGVVHVKVIGRQFKWYFWYPGKDGEFGTRSNALIPEGANQPEQFIGLNRDGAGKDDIVAEVMYAPVNTPVRCDVTSVDVIHSFFLPHFRVKQDATPGLEAPTWFNAKYRSDQIVGVNAYGQPKPYDIVCAELCGQGHFTMAGQLYVVSQSDFEKFLADRAADLGGDEFGF